MRWLPPCLLLLLSACASAAPPQPAPYVLLPGHMDLEIGPDGNTVVFDAPDGLVVVDSGRHPAHAQAIVDMAEQRQRPIAALVNTHWHLDHTTGNRDVLAAHPAARLVASAAMAGALEGFLARSRASAIERLADPDLPAAARARTLRSVAAMDDRAAMVPGEPVIASGAARIAGRRFALHIANAAATAADLWLVAPDEDVAVVGDLVVAPVPYFDTGCEEGWRRALAEIDAASWSMLVPGHGQPMTRADFTRWRGAFDSWLACAASGTEASTCAEGWMTDAAGFYTQAEADSVRFLAEAYVSEILRAPAAERMPYCRS